jgi:hypothetical protein
MAANAGFQILSKTEVKRDTKEIEKNTMFAVSHTTRFP